VSQGNGHAPHPLPGDAQRFLALLSRPGDVFELRALSKRDGKQQTTAGFFDDMTALARAAIDHSGKDDGVYITLNPVHPGLLSRLPANRVHRVSGGDSTSDRDIVTRRHLLVDVDPTRPAGISSDDGEHHAALELAHRMNAELSAIGWPEPILADSGNGAHLIYAINLPRDDGKLAARVLAELSRRYSTPELKIDEKNFNPARISKIYGTLTRKGQSTTARPHRVSQIVSAPVELAIVTREQLEAFAPASTVTPQPRPAPRYATRPDQKPKFDLQLWISEHLPDAQLQDWSGGEEGTRKWLLKPCPFNSTHDRGEAFIVELNRGGVSAGCKHDSCVWTWRELRELFEPGIYERKNGSTDHRITTREPPHEVLYEDADFAARQEAELEAFAARDREPERPPSPPAPDPWQQALVTALAEVKAALGREKQSSRDPLFLDMDALFAIPDEQTPWQVTGIVSRGGTATLGAEPKTCKTWVATEIAVAVATGTKAFGEYFAERGIVAYFYAEDRPNEVRNRVRALARWRGVDPRTISNLKVCPRGKFLDITKDEDLAWIIASCRKIGSIDLLVLDPLRDVHSASEDKSDEMAPVMKRLRLLGELLRCTVMVSHHAAKASESTSKRRPGQRMRGSSVIHGSTDSGIYLALNEGEDGGDGQGTFIIEADIEIKGARSAGALTLTLDLEDDASGAATSATWSVAKRTGEERAARRRQRSDAASTSKDDRIFAAVVKLHASGRREFCTARSVRAASGVHPRDVQACLDRLVYAGRLWIEEIQRQETGPRGVARTMTQTIYSPVVDGSSGGSD
jgi:hypothetical protein